MEPPSPFPWLAAVGLSCSVALAGGCSNGDGVFEDTDAVTGTTGSSTPDGYPEGPYGADVGEILPNLVWRGFVAGDGVSPATDSPYEDFSLDAARRSGARWALLHFGAVF